MNDIIKQIAEALDDPDDSGIPEKPRRKVSPMAASGLQHGRTEIEDPDTEAVGGTLPAGSMPYAQKRGGADFMANQLRKAPPKEEAEGLNANEYEEMRNKAMNQVSMAVKGLKLNPDPDFKHLREVLRRNQISGFTILDYFYYEAIERADAENPQKAKKRKLSPTDTYVKAIDDHDLLRTYSASPSARQSTHRLNRQGKWAGQEPEGDNWADLGPAGGMFDTDQEPDGATFSTDQGPKGDDWVGQDDEGDWGAKQPSFMDRMSGMHNPFRIRINKGMRRSSAEIRRIIKDQQKLQQQIHNLAGYRFPNIARKDPDYAGLSDEEIDKKVKAKTQGLQAQITELKQKEEAPRQEYEENISAVAEEYRDRIKKFKQDLLKVLPDRINQVLNKTYPKDYEQWLKTPHYNLGPVSSSDVQHEQDEEEQEDHQEKDYDVVMLRDYPVSELTPQGKAGIQADINVLEVGTFQSLSYDDAKAVLDAGAGKIRREEQDTYTVLMVKDFNIGPETFKAKSIQSLTHGDTKAVLSAGAGLYFGKPENGVYTVTMVKDFDIGGETLEAKSVYSLTRDDAIAVLDAGAGKVLEKHEEDTAGTTPQDMANAMRDEDDEDTDIISSDIKFHTLQDFDYDDDERNIKCEYCSVDENIVFHTAYHEYGTYPKDLIQNGYDPAERVVFEYALDGEPYDVVLRRHEVVERNLLKSGQGAENNTHIFPRGSKIYAVKNDTKRLVPLSYKMYKNLYRQTIKADRLERKNKTLSNPLIAAKSLTLPLNLNGEMCSPEDIEKRNYRPVDRNGGESGVEFTDLNGEKQQYYGGVIKNADSIIKALRESDLSNHLVFDQDTGETQNWIKYDKHEDVGKDGRMEPNALQILLPPTSESYIKEFGNKRINVLRTGYHGAHFVVESFPWALENGGKEDIKEPLPLFGNLTASKSTTASKKGWELVAAKNLPIKDAIIRASVMWDNHTTDPKPMPIKDNTGIHKLIGVEDPNNIMMTTYHGQPRRLLDVYGNVGKKDRSGDIHNTYCGGEVRDRKSGKTKKCGLTANHYSAPNEVALLTSSDKGTNWQMVSKQEAAVRQKLVDVQSGKESKLSADHLQNEINRESARRESGTTITGTKPMCDSCWLAKWQIIPISLIKAMFDDLEEISDLSASLMMNVESNYALAVVKKEMLDLLQEFASTYISGGSFWEVIIEYIENSSLRPEMKNNTIRTLDRFSENIGVAIYQALDPSLDLINQTTVDERSGKPWFSRFIDKIMVQVNQIFMWAHAYRSYRYEHKDANASRMPNDHFIIPFTMITSKGVRDSRELSTALSSMNTVPARVTWGLNGNNFFEGVEPDINGYDRVIIDGFLGEEAYYNGLAGYIVDKQGEMCTVRLDPNSKLLTEHIKAYSGELSVIWKAPKESDADEEYKHYVKEEREKEQTKDDIISLIGDNVSESPYY